MKKTIKTKIPGGGKKMKKTICVFLMFAVMITTLPGCATAKKPRPDIKGYTMEDVCDLATNEGKIAAQDKDLLWKWTGLLLPGVGTVLSLTVMPEIPEERLTDKNPVYVRAYTKCFEDEARGKQFLYSMTYFGPVLVAVVIVVVWLVSSKGN